MYYFEDLFFEVFKYWRNYIFISKDDLGETVFKIYEYINEQLDVEEDMSKKELLQLMNWSINVIVGDHLEKSTDKVFNLNSISLGEFEGRFKYDISIPEWSEYKSKYKGFREI